jgi:uncharacterized protein YfdQ (DUF2303 family)
MPSKEENDTPDDTTADTGSGEATGSGLSADDAEALAALCSTIVNAVTQARGPSSYAGAAPLADWAIKHGVQVQQMDLYNSAETGDVPDEVPVLVLTDANGGRQVISAKKFFDEYRQFPERRKGTAELYDLDSFIAHVNRHKDEDSVIFANPDRAEPSLLAIIDYNKAGSEDIAQPRYNVHRALYRFPLSDEWQAWQAQNVKPLSQADFALFLEDRIGEVLTPPEDPEDPSYRTATLLGGTFASPSKLLELSRGLKVHIGSRYKGAVNLSSGESQFTWETEHKDADGAPLIVPNLFQIAVPVFKAGELFRIAVRLRYRAANGEVKWWYNLYRDDKVFDTAFREAATIARDGKPGFINLDDVVVAPRPGTGLPVFIGKPEA